MIVRSILCLTSWLLLAQPTQAQSIRLNAFPSSATTDRVATQNITGTCGGAIVRVLGIQRSNDNTYSVDLDAGAVIVRSPAGSERGEIVVNTNNFLSDHNGIACLSGSAGVRLLLWTTCGGSSCPDAYAFQVIDPIAMRVVSPVDCEETCAARLTGDDLPLRLNSRD